LRIDLSTDFPRTSFSASILGGAGLFSAGGDDDGDEHATTNIDSHRCIARSSHASAACATGSGYRSTPASEVNRSRCPDERRHAASTDDSLEIGDEHSATTVIPRDV
jgi:hypothetical protein